jgi:glyoxylate reductase
MSRPRVLITNDISPEGVDFLRKLYRVVWHHGPLTERELLSRVPTCEALLTTLSEPITARVLRAAPRLKIVANCAVGFNNVDLQTARDLGIAVTNTPDVLTESTADLAWALLLSCARRVPEGERLARSGRFRGANLLMLRGLDLRGKTLGIFGCGRIGQAVARRGKGWDMKVVYHNRKKLPPALENALNAKYVGFQRLLTASDFLVVTAPLNNQTKGRFALREFKRMKPTAVFINIGRGPIHHEKDLATALRKRIIFYAGLDVYEREPLIEPELLRSDRVTLLPHIGSASVETRKAMALLAARNIDLVLRGKRPASPVT